MAIALSLALQFFSYGTADYSYEKMEHAAVKTAGGSVLIHARGYWKAQTSKHIVARPDAIVAAVNSLPHVTGTVTKVILTGLLSTTRGNRGTKIVGVYPESEAQLDDRSRFIEEGSFLESPTVGSGRRAQPPIVLGKSIVADLKLELGAKVKVTCTAPDGEVVHALFRLGGVMDTGSKAMDEAAAYIRVQDAQRLFRFGTAVTQVGVLVDDPTQRHTVTAAVKKALHSHLAQEAVEPLEVLVWDDALPEMQTLIELDRKNGEAVGYLIFIVVAFGIANTMLMSVLERVREFGLLGALGLGPGRIARLVLIESAVLGLVFISLGIGLGLLIHWGMSTWGLDFSETMSGGMEMSGVVLEDMVFYSKLVWSRWLTAASVIFLLIVISASYPAWKATRQDPASAMRTY
jgi:ABC-type lipoprotein release transport system permease subunit